MAVEAMGYQRDSYGYDHSGYEPPQHGTQDDRQRRGSAEQHVHRGTGPHRGKGPLGYQRSDERIRELVCESLTDDDQIDASQIEVSVKNGEVTLSGVVDDRRTKREAEDCACSVSGVRDVQNQLRVKDDRQIRRTRRGRVGQVRELRQHSSRPAPGRTTRDVRSTTRSTARSTQDRPSCRPSRRSAPFVGPGQRGDGVRCRHPRLRHRTCTHVP